METENSKIIYAIAKNTKKPLIDALAYVLSDVQFSHVFENIEQLVKTNFVIAEDKLTFNYPTGINIKRMRKKFLILCEKLKLNNKYINSIKNTYGKIFDIYIETIDEIYKYINNNDTETFAFKNIVYDLFKNYKDIDYLIII